MILSIRSHPILYCLYHISMGLTFENLPLDWLQHYRYIRCNTTTRLAAVLLLHWLQKRSIEETLDVLYLAAQRHCTPLSTFLVLHPAQKNISVTSCMSVCLSLYLSETVYVHICTCTRADTHTRAKYPHTWHP